MSTVEKIRPLHIVSIAIFFKTGFLVRLTSLSQLNPSYHPTDMLAIITVSIGYGFMHFAGGMLDWWMACRKLDLMYGTMLQWKSMILNWLGEKCLVRNFLDNTLKFHIKCYISAIKNLDMHQGMTKLHLFLFLPPADWILKLLVVHEIRITIGISAWQLTALLLCWHSFSSFGSFVPIDASRAQVENIYRAKVHCYCTQIVHGTNNFMQEYRSHYQFVRSRVQ